MPVKTITVAVHQDSVNEEELCLFTLRSGRKGGAPIIVNVDIERVRVDMEVDTGAEMSVIAEETWQKYFMAEKLASLNVILKSYTGDIMHVSLSSTGNKSPSCH